MCCNIRSLIFTCCYLIFSCAGSLVAGAPHSTIAAISSQIDNVLTLAPIGDSRADSVFVDGLTCVEQDATATDLPFQAPSPTESSHREVSLITERYHTGVDSRRFGERAKAIFKYEKMLRCSSGTLSRSSDFLNVSSPRLHNVVLLI